MAIFSRRTIQRMLNEHAAFLTKEQLNQHVLKLNKEDFQSLDTEWEVAVLNAFSKLGNVTHEPTLEGSAKLDLLFTRDGESRFLADITCVSDEGFEEKTSVKAFYVELQKHLRKAGLLYRGWSLTVGEHPIKYGEPRKPALPSRSEFAKEIFNSKFKSFLANVNSDPEQKQTYKVRTEETAISLTYIPNSTTFMSQLPVYNSAMAKNQNPVFYALKAKARQHKRVSFRGFRGIILCDSGSDMVNRQQHGAFNFNAADATQDFLRQNQSIDFVIILSSIWNDESRFNAWDELPARKIQVTIVGNRSFDNLPASLKECFDDLEQHFPEPTNTASGARETIRYSFDFSKPTKKHRGASFFGGATMSENEIKLSSRTVLDLLAGKITYEDFPETYKGYFESMVSEGRLLEAAKIEKDKFEKDDDWLVFQFGEPDPAITPYTVPKKAKPQK